MCKQYLRLCKNILGLCKGAISQHAQTQLRVAVLNKPFHLALIETFHLSFSLLTCKFISLSDRCWNKKATTRSNKAIMSDVVLSLIYMFYITIFLNLNSHWPHDVAWNKDINQDLGPVCSWPLILGVPPKVPEQTKSWLHFSIWTHFLVVVLEFMVM